MDKTRDIRRRTIVSIASGVLVAILVLTGGGFLLLGSAKKWSGQTTVMVLPSQGIAIGPSASYWDTLSRGQITSTVAQVLALPRFKDMAGNDLALSKVQLAATSVSATQVTGTALVTVTASGPDAAMASSMADAVVRDADPTVNALIAPYAVRVVSQTGGHASPSGTSSTTKSLVILAVVAIALGFGVQQGAMQLLSATSRQLRNSRAGRPGGDLPGMDGAGTGARGLEADERDAIPDLLELATTPDDRRAR